MIKATNIREQRAIRDLKTVALVDRAIGVTTAAREAATTTAQRKAIGTYLTFLVQLRKHVPESVGL